MNYGASELFAHIEQYVIAKGLDSPAGRSGQVMSVQDVVDDLAVAIARGNRSAVNSLIGESIAKIIVLSVQCGVDPVASLSSAYKARTKSGVLMPVDQEEE